MATVAVGVVGSSGWWYVETRRIFSPDGCSGKDGTGVEQKSFLTEWTGPSLDYINIKAIKQKWRRFSSFVVGCINRAVQSTLENYSAVVEGRSKEAAGFTSRKPAEQAINRNMSVSSVRSRHSRLFYDICN